MFLIATSQKATIGSIRQKIIYFNLLFVIDYFFDRRINIFLLYCLRYDWGRIMGTTLKLHLIINQNAGNGSGKSAAKKIIKQLTRNEIPFQTYYTEYPNHSKLLTQQLLETVLYPWPCSHVEHFPLLVVLGGDGTLHEVINALDNKHNIPVGYIPCGSGNDFARGVDLSRDPLKALAHLLSVATPQMVNTLIYHDNTTQETGYLTNNLGISIDANIVATANKSYSKRILNKLKLGSLTYLFSATKVLIKQKGFAIDIETPTETARFENAYLCTVTNHPYFGGGVALAPFANAKEEDMTLMVVERLPLPKLLRLVNQLLHRNHLTSPYVHQYRSTQLNVSCISPQYGQSDGEELGKNSFDISFTTQKRLFWL